METDMGAPNTASKQAGTPNNRSLSTVMKVQNQTHLQSIPSELKKYNQWVVWERKIVRGKPTKVPYNTNTGKTRTKARTDNPRTWGTYDQAYELLSRSKGYDGLGFVFSKDDPFIGLDWDHVRDPITGTIDEKILSEEILPLGSYAEVSPSGTGAHVIGIGFVPGDRNKVGDREMYHAGRFFTMTGMHIEGTLFTVEKVSQDALDLVYRRMVGDRAPQKTEVSAPRNGGNSLPPGSSTAPLEISDEEIIAHCLLAKNSIKFTKLFETGDKSDYDTHSEADMALCGILAFYTQDVTQIDRIVRQSPLYRPKWDEMRGSTTYGQRTIREALTGTLSQYNPHGTITRNQSWRIPVRNTFDTGGEEDLWKM